MSAPHRPESAAHPSRSDRRSGPLATLAEVARLVRDLPGEFLLGIEARAELVRARQAMYAAGWANAGESHADDVAELAMAWSRAEQDRERYRRALADIAAGRTPGVARAIEVLR